MISLSYIFVEQLHQTENGRNNKEEKEQGLFKINSFGQLNV